MSSSNLPFRLVAFDCDGTLVDSQHSIVAAMAAAFHACGLAEPSPAEVRRIVGLSLEDAISALLPRSGAKTRAAAAAAYREAFFALRTRPGHEEPLYPGVLDALDRLTHPEVFLGVCTGKARRGLLAVLERHGLVERFHTLQTSDICAGKPHPEMMLRAMAEVGAGPSESVLVGDTTYDMEMARRAQVWAIGVEWGYHGVDELRAAGAHRVIGRFEDLHGALGELKEFEA